MIEIFNRDVLRPLRRNGLGEMADNLITTDHKVRFQPPDDDWITYLGGLNGMAPSIYLANIGEYRKLR
jgi:hypothetical protein